jgi:aspartate dehydrogenase
MAHPMKVCIIGCGSIGGTLAKALQGMDEVGQVMLMDVHPEKAKALESELPKCRVITNFDEALDQADLIVEAANQAAAREYIPKALEKGRNTMLLSVGAMVDEDFRGRCRIIAKQTGAKVFIPSGAVCGIEGVGAAAQEDIEEIILMTYKPPKAFEGVDYFKKRGIDLDKITHPKVVFDGWAKDAVRYFPKNVNVAATISLAGVGFEKTRVKLVVDPKATTNTHRIIVKGKFGEIEVWTRNTAFPNNPRTSYLAALSAISAIKKIAGTVWVGV